MSALPSKSLRYFVAIAATAVVFTARFMLEPALGDVAQFLLFILSVVVAAWHGGLSPGLLATGLGVILTDYFFVEPLYSFQAKDPEERLDLFLFLCTGISISILSHARKLAEARSRQLLASERDARSAAE